jgi:predicted dehydrogenase
MDSKKQVVGVIGYGNWGPNLAKAFRRMGADVVVTDTSKEAMVNAYSDGFTIRTMPELLEQVQLCAVATPIASHFDIVETCLKADKDVLVEKPVTPNLLQTAELVSLAESREKILAVDHTFLFNSAIRELSALQINSHFGYINSYTSVRTNVNSGPYDIDVITDMGPHDFAICDFILGPVQQVRTIPIPHIGERFCREAHVVLWHTTWVQSHIHLSYRYPRKIREITIVGTEGMAVMDDCQEHHKIQLYNKHGEHTSECSGVVESNPPLDWLVNNFLYCCRTRVQPLTSGTHILRIARILDAAQRSRWSCKTEDV